MNDESPLEAPKGFNSVRYMEGTDHPTNAETQPPAELPAPEAENTSTTEPVDPLKQVFDVVIVGTGIVESIIAGCAAFKVLCSFPYEKSLMIWMITAMQCLISRWKSRPADGQGREEVLRVFQSGVRCIHHDFSRSCRTITTAAGMRRTVWMVTCHGWKALRATRRSGRHFKRFLQLMAHTCRLCSLLRSCSLLRANSRLT